MPISTRPSSLPGSISISRGLAANIHYPQEQRPLTTFQLHPTSCNNGTIFPVSSSTYLLQWGCTLVPPNCCEQLFSLYQCQQIPFYISSPSHVPSLTPSSQRQNKDQAPLVLCFYPTSLHIEWMTICNCHHLQRDVNSSHTFPSSSSAFCRDSSDCHP